MPAPSRLMIRLSLCYLPLGITFGALMLIHKATGLHPMIWSLLPLHIEVLFWGFIIQFTLGTAYWILPRYLQGPARGNKWLPWLMAGLLNAGILLSLLSSIPSFPSFDSILSVTGRSLELSAVGIFVLLHWNRIASYRNS